MNYILFIDDIRNPTDSQFQNHPQIISWLKGDLELIIARNEVEAIKTIKKRGMPSYFMFDHDLGVRNNKIISIREFINWLFDKYQPFIPLPEYSVHSNNPTAQNWIDSKFNSYRKVKEENEA